MTRATMRGDDDPTLDRTLCPTLDRALCRGLDRGLCRGLRRGRRRSGRREPAPAKRRRSVTRERLLDAASRVFCPAGHRGCDGRGDLRPGRFHPGAFYRTSRTRTSSSSPARPRGGGAVRAARRRRRVSAGVPNPIEALSQLLFEIAPSVSTTICSGRSCPCWRCGTRSSRRHASPRSGPSGSASDPSWRTGWQLPGCGSPFRPATRSTPSGGLRGVDAGEHRRGAGAQPADTLARRMLPVLLAAISRPAPDLWTTSKDTPLESF